VDVTGCIAKNASLTGQKGVKHAQTAEKILLQEQGQTDS